MTISSFIEAIDSLFRKLETGTKVGTFDYVGVNKIDAFGSPGGRWDPQKDPAYELSKGQKTFLLRLIPEQNKIVIEAIHLSNMLINYTLKDNNFQSNGKKIILKDNYVMTVTHGRSATKVKSALIAAGMPSNVILEQNEDALNLGEIVDKLLIWAEYREQAKEILRNENVNSLSNKEEEKLEQRLNLILYGPPGTGKTYNSINKALEIIGISTHEKTRDEIKKIYNEKMAKGQIAFTTFHQSMSYEDFIEGIKPKTTKDGGVNYEIESGIFKSISNRALQNLILDNKTDAKINHQLTFDILHELFLKDYEKYKGTKKPCFYTIYKHEMLLIDIKGSSVIVRFIWQDTKKTIPATQPFSVTKEKLKLLFDAGINPNEIKSLKETFSPYFKHNLSVYYAVYKSFYDFVLKNTNQEQLETIEVDSEYTFEELKAEWDLLDSNIQKKKIEESEKYLLIIDEINRGNVSQIFGELISLIEEDKRITNVEALEVILPYSKNTFGVAPNLYILGTMNTADRSVEALDNALRRRFSFIEIPPMPELLTPERTLQRLWKKYAHLLWEDKKWLEAERAFLELHEGEILVQKAYQELENINDLNLSDEKFKNIIAFKGISLGKLLRVLNTRIEKLLDKDHQIGHSYFMNVFSKEDLKQAFCKNIIPLLQEYFYGDYGKIGLILGEAFFEVNKEDDVSFKSFFDYPGDDLSEKIIYSLKDVVNMDNDTFLDAVKSVI